MWIAAEVDLGSPAGISGQLLFHMNPGVASPGKTDSAPDVDAVKSSYTSVLLHQAGVTPYLGESRGCKQQGQQQDHEVYV
jgi:hypothetical protein